LQRLGHVARDGAGEHEAVRVARRRDEVDAVAADVEVHVRERVHLQLAAVAAAGGHRAQFQRASEAAVQFGGDLDGVDRWPGRADDECLAPRGCQPEVVVVRELAGRARGRAVAAQRAAAEVDADRVEFDRVHGARRDARRASGLARGVGDHGPAAESGGVGAARVPDELRALRRADDERLQHGQRSFPQ
jgi:hypothetical protein